MSDSNAKYKQFRNYMTNELGITKHDIEAWTKEAVSDRVEKTLGQFDVQGTAEKAIERLVKSNITGNGYGQKFNRDFQDLLKATIVEELSGRLEISVKSEANN